MNKYYTGIGSRNAPQWALAIARRIAFELVSYGYTLRSGAAEGMDSAFETGCDMVRGNKEIYLPWAKFNNHPSQLYVQDELAVATAKRLHPKWESLSQGARKLHTRNVYQIVGHDWQTASRFVICYTPWDKGGTLQALRLANEMGISICNLWDYDSSLWDITSEKGINEILDSILNQVLVKRYRLITKEKKAFYCKLFSNYRYDGKCNDMACEFCDDYYDPNRKQWWYHPESESYVYTIFKEDNYSIHQLENVDDKIKTRVVNINKDEYDVFIGRGSKYGNPYKVGVDGDRKTVIEKFQDYLYNNDSLKKDILSLKGLRLGCYCSPEDCHGDIIAEYIENNTPHIKDNPYGK